MCVAIPYVPVEYAVAYLLYFSHSRQQAPPVLIHSPLPPPFPGTTDSGYGTVLSLCLEADRWKLVRSNNLQGVTFGSPSPHFLCSASLGGYHGGLDRWSRKERESLVQFVLQDVRSVCV